MLNEASCQWHCGTSEDNLCFQGVEGDGLLAQADRDATNISERLSACWKLFRYRHPRPDQAAATEMHLEAFAEFEAWKSVMVQTQLSPHWVKTFREVAMARAIEQERQAQTAQFLNGVSWMHEGPAAGLRTQHQFTKVKGGWVESATVRDQEASFDESRVEEGLSASQLRKALHPAAFEQQPADIQQETDLQAEAWRKERGSGLANVPQPEWPQDIGECPPRLLEDSIVEAAMSFPTETGLGWDGLHPKCLARLSRPAVRWIACVMLEAERTGKWHRCIGPVIIVLIPKGDGAYRPTGLIPWMPRLWMRAKRINATAWDRINGRDWIYAGVGKGADTAAWRQAARAEMAAM